MNDALTVLVQQAERTASAAANFYCYREQYRGLDEVAWYLAKAKTLIAAAEDELGLTTGKCGPERYDQPEAEDVTTA
jgi:hypothetical protein